MKREVEAKKPKHSKEVEAELAALKRAALHARKVARVYGTPIWIMRDGKVVAVKP